MATSRPEAIRGAALLLCMVFTAAVMTPLTVLALRTTGHVRHAQYAVMEASALAGPITESLVVNYADKRVKHDQIVPLEERFSDLIGRYAKTGEHRQWLQSKFELYRRLETKLFEHLTIVPEDLARLCSAASANIS